MGTILCVNFRYTGPVIYSICNVSCLEAANIQPTKACRFALGRPVARALLCLLALGAAVANASAGIQLRISLATTGVPSAEAPYSEAEASAAAQREAKQAAQAQLRAQVKALVAVYAAKSDEELTALSAQWQELPSLNRQVLLREVKLRMARQRGRKGSVQIRTERRFGRLLRQADGSVVRVETRVVRVRPAEAADRVESTGDQTSPVHMRKSAYGAGFERRSAPKSASKPVTSPLESVSSTVRSVSDQPAQRPPSPKP